LNYYGQGIVTTEFSCPQGDTPVDIDIPLPSSYSSCTKNAPLLLRGRRGASGGG
jgi:hypothetical protein